MTKLNRLFITCLAIFLLPKLINGAELIDKIVAVVNDELITLSELKQRASLINASPEAPKLEEKDILTQMIEQTLLEQEAKKFGIRVTEAELDATVEGVKKQYKLSEGQMSELLKKQNLTPEAFKEQWRVQILGNKLLALRLRGQIVVTEDEIQKEYEENYGKVEFEEETEIAHVLMPVNSPDEEEAAKKLAEEVTSKAKSGKDFGGLAKEYSKDASSAENGGEIGFFKKGDLVEPLDEAIRGKSIGDIVGPIRSPSGYHVIKILDKKESGESSLDDHRAEIKDKLYRKKAELALKDWLEEIKKTAYIDMRL